MSRTLLGKYFKCLCYPSSNWTSSPKCNQKVCLCTQIHTQNAVLEDNTHLATTAILPFGMTDNGIDTALVWIKSVN